MRVKGPTLWSVTRMARKMSKAGVCDDAKLADFSHNPVRNISNFLKTRNECKQRYGQFIA